MKRQFDIQIEKLKTNIIKMCSLVDEQVELSLRSIEEENMDFAKLVKERESKVDDFDVKIERICQKIFALNQPVAMDLRLIMSALTIINNLERIGDIAENIAENYLLLQKKPNFYNRTNISKMIKVVKEMIRNAIDSFIEDDPELAKKVIDADDVVDDLNGENHKILKDIMKENTENIEPGVAILVISRQMERMCDHATNIAEDVYFIVEAQLVKHKYEKYIFGDEDEEKEE